MAGKQFSPRDGRIASPLSYRADVDKLAAKARFSIKIIGGALAAFFIWRQLKEFPLIPLLESTQAGFVFRLGLTVYYFSWIFGANFDVSVQQSVYVRDANHGRLGWRDFGMIVVFGAVAALFLWASNEEKRFAPALSAFVIMNLVGWRVMVTRVISTIQMSLLTYGQDFFEIERLHIVRNYITGDWQRFRFLALCAIVLFVDAVSFFAPVRSMVSSAIASLVSGLNETIISPLLPALIFVMFLVIAEVSIWIMRGKTWMSLSLIDDLKAKYRIQPLAVDLTEQQTR